MLTKMMTTGTLYFGVMSDVFGTDGFKTVWCRNGEEYKEKCMVPTGKHGGGSVLMLGCIQGHCWIPEEQGESDSVAKYVS